jgi:hypothetical protein
MLVNKLFSFLHIEKLIFYCSILKHKRTFIGWCVVPSQKPHDPVWRRYCKNIVFCLPQYLWDYPFFSFLFKKIQPSALEKETFNWEMLCVPRLGLVPILLGFAILVYEMIDTGYPFFYSLWWMRCFDNMNSLNIHSAKVVWVS